MSVNGVELCLRKGRQITTFVLTASILLKDGPRRKRSSTKRKRRNSFFEMNMNPGCNSRDSILHSLFDQTGTHQST